MTGRRARRDATLTLLLTLVMAWSMLQLFAVAALAPSIGPELGIGPAALGGAAGAGFAVAAVFSPWAGRLADRWGARTCTAALLVTNALALGLASAARDGLGLACALALGGVAQALANPASNKAVSALFVGGRRAKVIGWKQSGVQLGALVAGVPLVLTAATIGWRAAMASLAVGSLVLALWALVELPRGAERSLAPEAPPTWSQVAPLAFFSVFLGVGVSSVNAHLTLFSTTDLGLSAVQGGALLAVLGAAGVAGRVFWTGRAARSGATPLLAPLAAGAAAGPVLLWASLWWGPLVWLAALVVGGLAVAANAVSMVAVVSGVSPSSVGRASAWVAAGFFTGFAVGPAVLGLVAQAWGYGTAWLWPAVALVCAAAIAARRPWRDRPRGH
ncbi:MFS transporter [Nocardiopsis sp. JB363]|uniref:MFS transporter n=1 Tax=Nocardiopsis sp. JB363 TaxID=1434837 RepID=UPI00135B0B10|nr:MFS transporter [Nocardiopsis sp. JB363]